MKRLKMYQFFNVYQNYLNPALLYTFVKTELTKNVTFERFAVF